MSNEKPEMRLTLDIAGIGISFSFDPLMSGSGLDAVQSPFITASPQHVTLSVRDGRLPEMGNKEKIFDSGETWGLYRAGGKYVLQNDALKPGSSPDTFVVLQPDLESGEVYFQGDVRARDFKSDPLGYPLNQVLMILLLTRARGLLLHACGIDDSGSGYLFLGHSGDGKSTMARFWAENGGTVLNDDRIVLREKAGELWMYGTPWHGDFREISPRGLPVQRVFFLRHGHRNRAFPKGGAEVLSMLLSYTFPPLWDEKGMAVTMDLCHRMLSQVPCCELVFERHQDIVAFVRDL